MSLNKVMLIGKVGADPKIRTTQAGKEIASFSVATNERWRDKATGEKKEKTEWHNILVFSEGLVKLTKNYINKGTSLYIEGQLQTSKYTDKNGVEKYTTNIVLQGYNGTINLLGGAPSNSGASRTAQGKLAISPDIDPQLDDDIPF